ncbi:uncharacterized protein LOC141919018 [Strix aluco]|uniref:uncharacterized protein LOC141919018 n=1 Tax=Strix aluco TaxID=111821 RepID=UPI003DA517A8
MGPPRHPPRGWGLSSVPYGAGHSPASPIGWALTYGHAPAPPGRVPTAPLPPGHGWGARAQVRAQGRALERRLRRVPGRALLEGLRGAGALGPAEEAALGAPGGPRLGPAAAGAGAGPRRGDLLRPAAPAGAPGGAGAAGFLQPPARRRAVAPLRLSLLSPAGAPGGQRPQEEEEEGEEEDGGSEEEDEDPEEEEEEEEEEGGEAGGPEEEEEGDGEEVDGGCEEEDGDGGPEEEDGEEEDGGDAE